FLEISRDDVARYARDVEAAWVDDPTNESMRFFRNRVRRDLLPALVRAAPGFDEQLIRLAHEARDWREEIDRLVWPLAEVSANRTSVSVAADDLAAYSREELASLWPAIAA